MRPPAAFRFGMSAVSNAVVVQEDGIWEDNYTWTTTNYTPAAGATGTTPASSSPTSHHGALHICTDITYALQLLPGPGPRREPRGPAVAR